MKEGKGNECSPEQTVADGPVCAYPPVADDLHQQIESLVHELQRRTTELEEANRELHRVGRYRSLFLARMSHELRTPLTSILGFAEILLDHEHLTDTQRRFTEKIQASGLQLQASLTQLVDLSRIEAGQTELFLHEFSLRETLRESCVAVARLAQKQEVNLECRPASGVGNIVSDEGKLRQVLYNFLSHAIGRSPVGGRVEVRAAPSEEGEPDRRDQRRGRATRRPFAPLRAGGRRHAQRARHEHERTRPRHCTPPARRPRRLRLAPRDRTARPRRPPQSADTSDRRMRRLRNADFGLRITAAPLSSAIRVSPIGIPLSLYLEL